MVEILKLMLNRDSEIVMFKICELWTVILWYELNPRVRCAFRNVFSNHDYENVSIVTSFYCHESKIESLINLFFKPWLQKYSHGRITWDLSIWSNHDKCYLERHHALILAVESHSSMITQTNFPLLKRRPSWHNIGLSKKLNSLERKRWPWSVRLGEPSKHF